MRLILGQSQTFSTVAIYANSADVDLPNFDETMAVRPSIIIYFFRSSIIFPSKLQIPLYTTFFFEYDSNNVATFKITRKSTGDLIFHQSKRIILINSKIRQRTFIFAEAVPKVISFPGAPPLGGTSGNEVCHSIGALLPN